MQHHCHKRNTTCTRQHHITQRPSFIIVFFGLSWPKHFAEAAAARDAGLASGLGVGAMRTRLVAPKEIEVADIQAAFEAWMSACGTRDLDALLEELQRTTTWKSAPKASTLSKYSSLYASLARLTPLGMLPNKKTGLAAMAAHKARPCNFSGKPISQWGDDLSGLLRAGFQKYRELKTNPEAHRRCLSKALSCSEKLRHGTESTLY